MKYGLKEKYIIQIQETLEKYQDVEQAILFGSRAKGNFKPYSDIDLVLVGNNLNLSITNKIELDLDDLFLPNAFDISIYHQITDPDVIEHIKRVGILFYKKYE